MNSPNNLPSHCRVLIIGGGIMGVGLAYHLGHEGWGEETILLEKSELTSGSTWHAAGQITQATSSFSLGKCVDYNIRLYSGALEAETGQAVSWHGSGSLRLAYSEDEMDWLRYSLSVGKSLGFEGELIAPARIEELHPFYNLDGVLGALYTPDDGHVDPTNVTMAMAAGARAKGVRIFRQCRATNITLLPGGEWQVETGKGKIICEHIVNAAGCYARQIGEWNGFIIPATSMTHHYFVTEDVPEFHALEAELPVVRDDARVSGYIRMEQKKGLIGIYEKSNPNSVWEDACPWEAENELFDPDYERVSPWLEEALRRVPIFAELGISRVVHGAISHPPDGNPLIGPLGGAKNYWLAAGTQIGIGWGPGLTRELARWMVHGAADINMRDYDPRRFGSYADKPWQIIKAHEDYCLRHEIPFPHFNRLAGRPLKPSPIYDRLKAKGAVFEEVYGFERPRWFAKGGVAQEDHYSFCRNALHGVIGEEVRAVRERVGVMDITGFAKVMVEGPHAYALLDWLSCNRLPQKAGRIALAPMLNRAGRIEVETTITRMGEERFYLNCAAFFEGRLLDHLNQAAGEAGGRDVQIRSCSRSWSALALNGPKSRHVLEAITDTPLGNAGFPWLSAQAIKIAGHELWALRMSYAGELGWELHMPNEAMEEVYEAVIKAGEAHGIADYGSFAMNVLRLEKGFKGAGELTNEVTPGEAGLGNFARADKDYLGKEAGESQALRWQCVYMEIEGAVFSPENATGAESDGHGGEAVYHQGERVGSLSSIAYGHHVGKLLAFAYVKGEAAKPGTRLEVIIQGQLRGASVLAEPAYDPNSTLPRTDA